MPPRQFRDVNRIGLAVTDRFREREQEKERKDGKYPSLCDNDGR